MRYLFMSLIMVFSAFASYQPYEAKDFSYLLEMKDFDPKLLHMHFKLYQGYVRNCNLVDTLMHKLAKQGKERSYEFGALKRRFGWEFDGMRLHELYFSNLGGKGKIPTHGLMEQVSLDFGSVREWKEDFKATGLIRGIGWVILYFDPVEDRLFNIWINEHDLGHLAGCEPLLVMDVWEHAYITQFGLDRAKYIDIFFDNIDWDIVTHRYERARGLYGIRGRPRGLSLPRRSR
jgi:superoxide dismutase, Fe-Mn family